MNALSRTAARLIRRAHTRTLSSPVTVQHDGKNAAVRVLTLSSPSNLNAMTVAMGDAVEATVLSLRDLPPAELKAVVITGEGRVCKAWLQPVISSPLQPP